MKPALPGRRATGAVTLQGARNSYYQGDLVVADKHVGLVARALDELGLGHTVLETSPALGLGLFRLHDPAAAVTTMRRKPAGRAVEGPAGREDIGFLLRALRHHLARQHAGWVPVMGKNRIVGQVIGGGKISHGGGGAPRPVDEALPRRTTRLGDRVRVGVLDTSISANEWLAGGWVTPPGGVLRQKRTSRAAAGHATFVAGLVLRQAPGCTVEARRVLSDQDGEADSWSVAKAIVELGGTRPDVLNLSFMCYTEDGRPPLTLATALNRLDPEIVVVAAAGNHGNLDLKQNPGFDREDRRKPAWPAALDRVVAVAAAHDDGRPAEFTPARVPWVDLAVPGVDVLSTFLRGRVDVGQSPGRGDVKEFNGFARWSGTSFAAATLSGAIAARTLPGQVSAAEALAKLRRAARPGQDGDPPFLPLG